MTAFEQIRKVYQEAQKNNFWDAWGIVASPKTLYDLRAECLEQMAVYNDAQGMIDSVFGLVLIPCTLVGNDVAYVVDEQLGRTILGEERMEESRRFPTDDITWCWSDCVTDCPRQPKYIRDNSIPHSFADFSRSCMAYEPRENDDVSQTDLGD